MEEITFKKIPFAEPAAVLSRWAATPVQTDKRKKPGYPGLLLNKGEAYTSLPMSIND